MILKNFADMTGSDIFFADQDWTRTEKFHSLLISDEYVLSTAILHVGLVQPVFSNLSKTWTFFRPV